MASSLFTDSTLTHKDAEAVLTPELLGPPAERYDHDARTEGPTELEAAVEAALFGKRTEELAASDSLRRFGRAALVLRTHGEPQSMELRFLTEHAGLVAQPEILGWFTVGGSPEEISEFLIKQWGKELSKMTAEDMAVVLVPGEQEGAYNGLLALVNREVQFDPFERRVEPGESVRISGHYTGDGDLQGLYLNRPGGEVEVMDIPATGVFRLSVPMPEEPGIYRAAVSRNQKRRLPDSPYYFTFYVGVEPPTAFEIPELITAEDDEQTIRNLQDVETFEAAFVEAVNELRGDLDRPPLDRAGDPTELRTLMAEMPKGEAAKYRYLRRAMKADPLPEQPHGMWDAGFAYARTPGEAVWNAFEHPVTRSSLTLPASDTLTLGANVDDSGTFDVFYVALEPAKAGSPREEVRMLLSEDGFSETAPRLEAELDRIAANIASGKWSLNKGLKKASALHGKSDMLTGNTRFYALIVAPGEAPDLSSFDASKDMSHIAIGEASGTLNNPGGIAQTVLIITASSDAK